MSLIKTYTKLGMHLYVLHPTTKNPNNPWNKFAHVYEAAKMKPQAI